MLWYNQYTLSREVPEHTSTLSYDLYSRRRPEGEAISILVKLKMITDRTPGGEEISVVVRRLEMGRREFHRQ